MPVYEFECHKCHAVVSGIYPMGQGPKRHAGGCGGVMQRLMGTPAVHFITNRNGGSGWSENGYRNHEADYMDVKGKRYKFLQENKSVDKIIG